LNLFPRFKLPVTPRELESAPREFENAMKLTHLIVFVMAGVITSGAQTQPKPAAPAAAKAKPAATAAKPAAAVPATDKLPAGIPPIAGVKKIAFSLRYQDIEIGTGPDAVPLKMYKVNYIGWLGNNGRDDDGKKFDSSADHPAPVTDKDGKPVMDADGKPKMGPPQPIGFPQGFGRVIPGWDQGFNGMKIGGKRRLFIPWQLAYGAMGRPGPDPAHPVIPAKVDLIFDVELVDITDMPMPPNHPGMGGMPGARPGGPGGAPNGASGQPGAHVSGHPTTPDASAPSAPATPPAPANPPAPAAPPSPAQPQPK
jgi:peptidylprolyl isomerase